VSARAATASPSRAREARALGEALLYLAPSLAIFVVFVFVPLARGVYLSLYYTNPVGNPTTFAGLEQYLDLFRSDAFRSTLVATFLFALYTVPSSIVLALLLAVLANQQLRGINVFRTLMSSTIAVSAAVGALIWFLLFNPSLGLLNFLLALAHLPGPEWLTDPNRAILAVSITTLWLTLGFNVIVLLAGLQGIPEQLYESARIDGAVGLNTFRHITVPLLSPSLFFLLVVDTISVCQAFTQIHLLTHGGPVDTTRTLVYAIYRDGFIDFRFGFAQTEAFVLFLLILVLTLVQFRALERRVHYQ
jgi:ABC-type sugar transport system permease subunit